MSDQPRDYGELYPASRGRPLSEEEKLAIKAQQEEAARQEARLREVYPHTSPARPADARPRTVRDLYPKSVDSGNMDDGPFSDGSDAA